MAMAMAIIAADRVGATLRLPAQEPLEGQGRQRATARAQIAKSLNMTADEGLSVAAFRGRSDERGQDVWRDRLHAEPQHGRRRVQTRLLVRVGKDRYPVTLLRG
jgi:hypothetical protein